MITNVLLTGIFIGFCIALPFGGNAVLCAQNTLLHGGKTGIFTGLGAATAHASYSLLGLSGLVAVEALLAKYLGILEVLGGLFLCYFGLSTILKKIPDIKADNSEKQGLIKTYLASTLFAFTNPKSIIVAAVLIAESGAFGIIDAHFKVLSLVFIIVGVFIGSTLWWLILVTTISLLKKILDYTYLTLLNRAFSVLVIASGLFFAVLGLGKTVPFSYSFS